MVGRILFLVIFATATVAAPALADDARPLVRQILLMWLPLLLIIGLWVFFIRRMQARNSREPGERGIPDLHSLDRKLDRIIELLERREKR